MKLKNNNCLVTSHCTATCIIDQTRYNWTCLLGLGLRVTSHLITLPKARLRRPTMAPLPLSRALWRPYWPCPLTRARIASQTRHFLEKTVFLFKYLNLLLPPFVFVACHMLHLVPRQFSGQTLASNGLIPCDFAIDFNYIGASFSIL